MRHLPHPNRPQDFQAHMKAKLFALFLLALICLPLVGCGEQANKIDPNRKDFLTPEERKQKRDK